MIAILAYFDPGPGSLLVQVIVGGLAGLAVFGKYLWNAFVDRFRHHDRNIGGGQGTSLSGASSGEIPINPS
ncbi:MAG TPA: hypothetical protein VGH74_02795 [Planctomycetaceae bacterium]